MSSEQIPSEETTTTTATTTTDAQQLHKLNDAWSLWYLPEVRQVPGQPTVNMNDLLRKADSFDTIEEFWSIYNALPPADKLTLGEQFMFFRNPIKPIWEDAALARGEMFT